MSTNRIENGIFSNLVMVNKFTCMSILQKNTHVFQIMLDIVVSSV